MTIKHALLALLVAGPATTYQLRKDFEASTGQTWPLNIGQVSSTLERLARDGLVWRGEGPADPGSTSRAPWHLSELGRDELARWWQTPVPRHIPERDELVIKLALAVSTPGVDVSDVLLRQRAATQRVLHDITRAQRGLETDDLAARLVLHHHLFATEADLRWLDDIEAILHRAASSRDQPLLAGGTGGQSRPAAGQPHRGSVPQTDRVRP